MQAPSDDFLFFYETVRLAETSLCIEYEDCCFCLWQRLNHAFELKEFDNKAAYEEAIVKLLDDHQIDLVCLAGYMKIVGPTLLAAYEGRIINIHPAYLPEFPGAHGIEDAWNAGVDQSGVTIHWVDSGVDTGKVIKQVRVPRLEDDTLDTFETRIHEAEYKLYPEVLDSLGVEKKEDG
ncbi:MAG: phosphoribosylglycinamide formyltransferase [Streptococcus sp.]|uniref:phosphoribosylglycinamide formyltransferase n=1 Tax=Streptococcus sp. TaxID=1306 RepID=UPI0028FEA705|nr:phosphoribosylglycinamide formyltransferase [Streptococcus sp.]MDU3070851.1 phosphoribosylglycinamide formyltransferase [Streptococcus sp.]